MSDQLDSVERKTYNRERMRRWRAANTDRVKSRDKERWRAKTAEERANVAQSRRRMTAEIAALKSVPRGEREPRLLRSRAMRRCVDIKRRAAAAGVPFDMTWEDIPLGGECPCCGLTIPDEKWLEIDRVVPDLGYIKANIVGLCGECNRKKDNSTPEEMYRIADFVYAIRRERGLEDVKPE